MHRDFVRRVVDHTKTPPTRIATDIDISPSTLTRLLNDPGDGKATLRATTIAKLEAYSGLKAPTLELDGARSAPGLREDATPYKAENVDPAVTAAIKAIVGGRKNIDAWTIKSRSLECAGFVPGDIVLVDLSIMPLAGEAACAQVYDWRTGTAETIMRIWEPPYLVASSFDPNLRKPLLREDDRIILKGLVLPHRLRPRGP